jgi:GntR family transcriptional repressor for pyruvate dehydrogenase complex
LELLLLLDGISMDDLLETRLIVEPELAFRAAERATLEDLERMRLTLLTMQREKDEAKLIESDLVFHESISQAARNLLCSRVFVLIHRAMVPSIAMTSKLVDWNHTLSFHLPIYEAIEKRLPSEARQKMIEHLLDARQLLARIRAGGRRLDLISVIRPVAP